MRSETQSIRGGEEESKTDSKEGPSHRLPPQIDYRRNVWAPLHRLVGHPLRQVRV